MADSFNSGGWLLAGGLFISMVGVVLTATGIGAICGLPLIFFIGLPMKVVGILKIQKSRKVLVYAPPPPVMQIGAGMPPQNNSIFCGKCGSGNNYGSKFCFYCGNAFYSHDFQSRKQS